MTQVVRTEIRKRGVFGKFIKFLFIAFNVLMIVWLLSYWVQVGQLVNSHDNEAFKTGASVGATLGTGFIIFFWAAGDVVVGLFVLLTRGKKLIIEESYQ